MNTGQIIKSKLKNDFTQIPNTILRSEELTLEEKGMMCFLLSLPDNWVLYRKNLYNHLNDKPGTIDRVFRSLQKHGYILSVKVIDPNTHTFIGWNHIVYDCKQNAEIEIRRDRQTPKSANAEIGKSAPISNTVPVKNTVLNKNIERYNVKDDKEIVKDFEWYKSQFDEIYLDILKNTHPTKVDKFEQAMKESYVHLLNKDIETADKSRCRILLNTWLANIDTKPEETKYSFGNSKPQWHGGVKCS